MASKPLDYLPTEFGSVLFTSRSQHEALQLVDECDTVIVPPMTEGEAVELISKRLQPEGDEPNICELARALDYVPLALAQATSYIRQRAPRSSIRQYIEQLQKSEKSQTSLLNRDDGNVRRDKEASNSIILTWQISFEHIKSIRPSAADLLSLMSMCDREAIPECLLRTPVAQGQTSGVAEIEAIVSREPLGQDIDSSEGSGIDACSSHDDLVFEDDIALLRDYSFINTSAEMRSFDMHRLVQFAMQRWLQVQGQLGRWQEHFVTAIHAAVPANGMYKHWAAWRVLYPHAKSAMDLEFTNATTSLRWAAMLHRAAWYSYRQGAYMEAESMNTAVMNVRVAVLGWDDEETLGSLRLTGGCLREQGRYQEAETLLSQLLESSKRVLGKESFLALLAMCDLGVLYTYQENDAQAEQVLSECMGLCKQNLGEENYLTVKCTDMLTGVFVNQGRYREAEPLQEELIEVSTRVNGAEHPNTLLILHNRALTSRKQGQLDKAAKLLSTVLQTQSRVLGEEHPHTLGSAAQLADVYHQQKRWQLAEGLSAQTLRARRKVLGMQHPHTLNSLSDLSWVYVAQGRWQEAEELALKALALRRAMPHAVQQEVNTVRSMSALSAVYRGQGRFVKAMKLAEEVLDIRKKALGPRHPITLAGMCILALSLWDADNNDSALSLLKECATLSSEVLGADHPDTIERMKFVAEYEQYARSMTSTQRQDDRNKPHTPQLVEAAEHSTVPEGQDATDTGKLAQGSAKVRYGKKKGKRKREE